MNLPDRIRQRLDELELSADAVSRSVGSNPNLIGDILRGTVKSPRATTIEKIARALNVSTEWLITGQTSHGPVTVTPIPVVGVIEAGAFRSAEVYESTETRFLPGIAASDTDSSAFALEVRGSSIDKFCPDGGYVVCLPIHDCVPAGANPAHFLHGKFVAVERIKPDGSREVTVKRYMARDGLLPQLVPHSHHPLHQKPVVIDDDPECEVRVFGVVRYKIEAAP